MLSGPWVLAARGQKVEASTPTLCLPGVGIPRSARNDNREIIDIDLSVWLVEISMEMKLSDATQILERTPGLLNQVIRGLPEEWIRATEGEDTWSCYDVVGHLIHGELTDWMPRVRMILEHGENRSFAPFDRVAQFREDRAQSLDRLLDRFKELREQNLAALKSLHLGPGDFSRTGVHPELGTVTLRQLLSTWVVHDLTHISQISRVLAKQYEAEVGPWKAYMGILNTSIDRSGDNGGSGPVKRL
jgi:DinB superfamily